MTRNSGKTLVKGTSDEHYTPKWLFDKLGVHFDMDVCAPENGSNVPCNEYLTKLDDGLITPWNGNVWMNPPYSSPTPWVLKFASHHHGIALLPVTRGKWFDHIWRHADAICLLPYNMTFERPDGLASKPILFRTALFAIGAENRAAVLNSGIGFCR